MPFEIIRNDITKMNVDAIVNAANRSLLGGGGVDGMIHHAAGPQLLEECRTLHGCETGEAKITRGYQLPAKYVIHTVGPIWQGGANHERDLLSSCYRNALTLALQHGCETVAFPMISAGAYGYPKDQAMMIAVETIGQFLMSHEMTVYLVVFGREEFITGTKLFRDVREYIDDAYSEKHLRNSVENLRERLWHRNKRAAQELDHALMASKMEEDTGISADLSIRDESLHLSEFGSAVDSEILPDSIPSEKNAELLQKNARINPSVRAEYTEKQKASLPTEAKPFLHHAAPEPNGQMSLSRSAPGLKDLLRKTDESFSEALLRLIDERGLTDTQCYKRANVDRKLFSKIRSNPAYRPSKQTALAFAIALELTLRETENLIRKAGYALTKSSKFDIVLEYFIQRRFYNIHDINMVLFELDLPLLGSFSG